MPLFKVGSVLIQRNDKRRICREMAASVRYEGCRGIKALAKILKERGFPKNIEVTFSNPSVSLQPKGGFSKIIPSFFFDKASCTRQFESKLSLHSLASLFPIKEGSTFLTKPLFNSLYAPFGSPSSGGQKPSGTRGCNRPTVLTFLPLRLSCKENSTS